MTKVQSFAVQPTLILDNVSIIDTEDYQATAIILVEISWSEVSQDSVSSSSSTTVSVSDNSMLWLTRER